MKKTLYLSDLDGTLFNEKKEIGSYSVDLINQCIDRGAHFAVATARMPYGCDYRLECLHMNIPSILTNGVFLYDFFKKRYIQVNSIRAEYVPAVLKTIATAGVDVFLYTFSDDGISIFYENHTILSQTQYYSDHAIAHCQTIQQVQSLAAATNRGNVIYLACTGEKQELYPLKEALEKLPGIGVAFYLNIYNGKYCLEVYSETASKKHALCQLQKYLDCDEVVVFGDNLNDLSMFEVATRCYAVENALPEVKACATGVIGNCKEDGVAKFLAYELGVI